MDQVGRQPVDAYIALGSNLGDRAAYVRQAVAKMGELPGVRVLAASRVLETKAIGPEPQGDYLNGVVRVETTLAPKPLLDALLAVERDLGRVREKRWGPRTIDLDILFYGDQQIREPGLQIPHPEIRNRPFLIECLKELGKIVQ